MQRGKRACRVRSVAPLAAMIAVALATTLPATLLSAAVVPAHATSNTSCAQTAYRAENGAQMSVFATGFPSGASGTNSCTGIIGMTFDSGGNAYLSDQFNGNLYHFSPAGGTAGQASYLGHSLGVAA